MLELYPPYILLWDPLSLFFFITLFSYRAYPPEDNKHKQILVLECVIGTGMRVCGLGWVGNGWESWGLGGIMGCWYVCRNVAELGGKGMGMGTGKGRGLNGEGRACLKGSKG